MGRAPHLALPHQRPRLLIKTTPIYEQCSFAIIPILVELKKHAAEMRKYQEDTDKFDKEVERAKKERSAGKLIGLPKGTKKLECGGDGDCLFH